MSREEKQHEFSFHDDDNTRTNAGFDGPSGGMSDSFSHGGQQKTEWQKKVDEMIEEFLAECPGSHGTSGNFRSASSSSEQGNPLRNVGLLLVKIKVIIVISIFSYNIFIMFNCLDQSFL